MVPSPASKGTIDERFASTWVKATIRSVGVSTGHGGSPSHQGSLNTKSWSKSNDSNDVGCPEFQETFGWKQFSSRINSNLRISKSVLQPSVRVIAFELFIAKIVHSIFCDYKRMGNQTQFSLIV